MMRWDYGSVYKEIRQAKGLTQTEVCGDYLSRTTLAKFEANQANPRFETMEYLLRQLDMTFAEFEHLCNYNQPSQRNAIITDFRSIGIKKDLGEIEQLAQKCEIYLKQNHDIPITNILRYCQLYSYLLGKRLSEDQKVARKLSKQIWKDLSRRNTWYISDIRMINMILTSFPIEYLDDLVDQLIKSLKKYRDFADFYSLRFSILANVSTIYLYDNQKEKCEELTGIALELAKQMKQFDKLAFCQIRLGICRNDQTLIENGVKILELTGEEEMLKRSHTEIEHFAT